ncbi:MAG TPA: disulfide isomerase DsbC N-terminal domain-containing protein, partial [Noviherbaspirillum sp.]
MKTLIRVGVAALLSISAFAATAQTGVEASLKKSLAPRLGEGVQIDSVVKTPYGGLYEVRIGSDIFYTDAKGDYL